ncbi:alcohol dehydrogenase catalytic domain-containing protein [Herbiconiux sp. VKM Ac-1786]|uniref:alcohol dehydrogenase catalytic domain-containing protein n=1 Tax=Herbiconiux sp. VKM Ac-1786 TaxID=2783824 RepID=UPI001E3909E4|nr:alcohol dehydrogenase catalytic domain-containing protein [Herbiconiux sp. VKM Ac-1786]
MRAVVYVGPRQVSVKDVPDARIERPTDALVRITTTNICGSDLHMYEGRTDFEPGRWFGHENMGEVVEVGDGVDKLRVGDRVVMPFNVACGHCKNCERGLTNYCLTAQPEKAFAGAAYGFADMGPWAGGQAELLRVPWADFNCLRLGRTRTSGRRTTSCSPTSSPPATTPPRWPGCSRETRPSSTGPGRWD